jgi:hypothetical protein
MQNEYNSPSAMRKRYEDAGINPMLPYSKGAANVPATGNVKQSRANLSLSSDPLGEMLKFQQIQNLKATEDNIRTNTAETDQTIAIRKVEEELALFKNSSDIFIKNGKRLTWQQIMSLPDSELKNFTGITPAIYQQVNTMRQQFRNLESSEMRNKLQEFSNEMTLKTGLTLSSEPILKILYMKFKTILTRINGI